MDIKELLPLLTSRDIETIRLSVVLALNNNIYKTLNKYLYDNRELEEKMQWQYYWAVRDVLEAKREKTYSPYYKYPQEYSMLDLL